MHGKPPETDAQRVQRLADATEAEQKIQAALKKYGLRDPRKVKLQGPKD